MSALLNVCHVLLRRMLNGGYFEVRIALMRPPLSDGDGALWAAFVLGSDLITLPAIGSTEESALHWLASYLVVRIRRFGSADASDVAVLASDELLSMGLDIAEDAVSAAESENTFDALIRRWSVCKAFVDLSNRVRRLEGREEEFVPLPPMEAALWNQILWGKPVR